MLQALKTRILPGRDKQGRYRVAVSAYEGWRVVYHIVDIFGEDYAHQEAARCAVIALGDGWQGDYVGGMYNYDGIWVRLHSGTPHTSTVSLGSSVIEWSGGMP